MREGKEEERNGENQTEYEERKKEEEGVMTGHWLIETGPKMEVQG